MSQHHRPVYYGFNRVPPGLKTRNQLLLAHRQPVRSAPVRGVLRTIAATKWRYGGGWHTLSPALIDQYRREADAGSLSDAEFGYLQRQGYGTESHLFDMADTEPLAPTEGNGRNFLARLAFDGSHKEQYINEANAVRANRRTYKSRVSRPGLLDHLRGFNVVGPVRDEAGYYRFIAFDLDRHSYTDPERFTGYVLAVHAFLVRHLPDCALVAQVNPRNGSTVFFCFLPRRRTFAEVRQLVSRLDAAARAKVPGYATPEIYPVVGPGKVFLPFNPEKATIGDTGPWPKTMARKSKTCSRMPVYSLAGFPEYVRTARKADADAVRREVLAACRRPLPARKTGTRKPTHGTIKRTAGVGGTGTGPRFKGRFLRTMVDFFTGGHRPEPDTIGKYLTPWARAIAVVEGCDEFDELKARLQRCIDLIPDTGFSDRLTDDPGELERVLDYALKAVLDGNRYQPHPEASTAILAGLKKTCDRIGFVPSDPATWDALDRPQASVPGLALVWTPDLHQLVRDMAPVLNAGETQVRELLGLVFNWIEARSETAYRVVARLMGQVGIKGHNDKVAAFLAALQAGGFVAKAKNYGHFRDADGGVRRHGTFYVNTAKVAFVQQVAAEEVDVEVGEGSDQAGGGVVVHLHYYLSFLDSERLEHLLEHRRLTADERYRRRVRGWYRPGWRAAA